MKPLLICLAAAIPMLAATAEDTTKRIHESASVLSEIMNAGDNSIPQALLDKAQCVGIVPNLKHGGFIVGAKYGKGLLTCRVEDTASHWSAPSTIRIEGGSIGLQIGAGETDLVFIVMNQSGVRHLMEDKFTVGAQAGVMAGPVGRSASAATDAQMSAEILAYSRSRGIFAGVSLDGATLRPDTDDNHAIYGANVTQRELLTGKVKPTTEDNVLFEALNRWSPYKPSKG